MSTLNSINDSKDPRKKELFVLSIAWGRVSERTLFFFGVCENEECERKFKRHAS